jgi:hypothetical protein
MLKFTDFHLIKKFFSKGWPKTPFLGKKQKSKGRKWIDNK